MSGLLAGIYSAGDTAKRKLRGLLDDPIGTIQQQIGLLNDNAGKFNQLHSQATQESVNAIKQGGSSMGPASVALSNKLADAYNPMGITVWHGSPHKFSKFDSSKIGTGEGAQAYGHGLYLAESPEVAKQYADNVKDMGAVKNINAELSSLAKQMAADEIPGSYRKYRTDAGRAAAARYDELMANRSGVGQAPGSLYKVDLPDEHVAKMLDWDKPLSQQAPEVQAALSSTKNKQLRAIVDYASSPYSTPGLEGELKTMGEAIKLLGMNASPAKGSQMLAKHGIPGIRYLDGGSRGAGGGTSNFVVFPGNEGLLSILERNGQPIK